MQSEELITNVARRIYEDRHAGMNNIWNWDDNGLDDEHPGVRAQYEGYAKSAIAALSTDAEPVVEIVEAASPFAREALGCDIKALVDLRTLPVGTKLYAAPPAPSVAVKALAKELEQLLDLLKDMPAVDRGYSWELRNSRGHEEIRAYGENAKTFKFVIDNREALISALSAQVQDVAEYERHAEYLETIADVIMGAGKAGRLEAKLTMEKAAGFIRRVSPAASAKQEASHVPGQ